MAQLFTAVFRRSIALVEYPDLAKYHPKPDFEIRYLNKKAPKKSKKARAADAEADGPEDKDRPVPLADDIAAVDNKGPALMLPASADVGREAVLPEWPHDAQPAFGQSFSSSSSQLCLDNEVAEPEPKTSNPRVLLRGLGSEAVAGASPEMDAYSRHIELTKTLVQQAAQELKVAASEPLTRAMQKSVSDAAKRHWAKRPAGDVDSEAAVPASRNRGRGNGRGSGRGNARGKGGRGKGRGKGGRGTGRGKGRGKGAGKAPGRTGANLRRSLSRSLSMKPKSKAAAKPKASAKTKAKKNLAEAEVPASFEHPVDRLNAELRALEHHKGQEFDASRNVWGRVSDDLRSKLRPLVYKLEKWYIMPYWSKGHIGMRQGYQGIQCLYQVRLLQSHPEWNAVDPNFRREYEKLLHQWD
ncbi:unnamed protein product [Symbiodinium sp. KB8]|nr:unnamed protein product [Symbiodinium sp. KB8]